MKAAREPSYALLRPYKDKFYEKDCYRRKAHSFDVPWPFLIICLNHYCLSTRLTAIYWNY